MIRGQKIYYNDGELAFDMAIYNKSLYKVNLPKVENIGDRFLYYNGSLEKLYLPNVKTIGNDFLSCNELINREQFLK